MRKAILTAMLMAGCAQGAGLSLDLGSAYKGIKQLHGRVTSATEWRRATGAVLMSANIIDWRTTYIGVVNGPDCEGNPVFRATDGCKINRPRFDTVKALILVVLATEEITPKLPHSDIWNRTFTIANVALAIPLAIADVNNIHVLTTQK